MIRTLGSGAGSDSRIREKDLILHVDHPRFKPGLYREQRQAGPDLGLASSCTVADGEGGQR
jgi:hypothetical protein